AQRPPGGPRRRMVCGESRIVEAVWPRARVARARDRRPLHPARRAARLERAIVDNRQSHAAGSIRLSGAAPRAILSMLSAMSRARAASLPWVQPEPCGVISTLPSSWNGCVAGGVAPGALG